MKIPVLIYHALQSDSDLPVGMEDEGRQLYVLQTDRFEAQMQYLGDQGFRTVLINELCGGRTRDGKQIVVTFDDGCRSDLTLALPIIKRNGFRAYFFITTAWIGRPGYLTADGIRKLAEEGMVVGSHGVTHSYLEDLSDEKVRSEMAESRQRLEQITGSQVDCFSAPGGRILPHHFDIATGVGYRAVFTSQPAAFDPSEHGVTIPRIAVKRDHTLAQFSKIATMNSIYFMKARLLKKALDTGKSALGNRGYERLRAAVLRIMR